MSLQRITWEALANRPNWRDFILPGRSDAQFDDEGRQQAEALANMVGIGPGHFVVDYGCGVGRVTRHLAPLCRAVVGMDISRTLVARASAQPDRPTNVLYHHVDDFAEEGFADFVVAVMVMQHNVRQDRVAILRRARVLLASGGLLVANYPRPGFGAYVHHDRTGADAGFVMKCFPDLEEVREEAVGVGFDRVDVVTGNLVAYASVPPAPTAPGNEWWLMARR